jgi:hypothetical protein
MRCGGQREALGLGFPEAPTAHSAGKLRAPWRTAIRRISSRFSFRTLSSSITQSGARNDRQECLCHPIRCPNYIRFVFNGRMPKKGSRA